MATEVLVGGNKSAAILSGMASPCDSTLNRLYVSRFVHKNWLLRRILDLIKWMVGFRIAGSCDPLESQQILIPCRMVSKIWCLQPFQLKQYVAYHIMLLYLRFASHISCACVSRQKQNYPKIYFLLCNICTVTNQYQLVEDRHQLLMEITLHNINWQ